MGYFNYQYTLVHKYSLKLKYAHVQIDNENKWTYQVTIKSNKLQVNMELNRTYLLNIHYRHSKCLLIEWNNNTHENNHANGYFNNNPWTSFHFIRHSSTNPSW
jgi:hypothetical protein